MVHIAGSPKTANRASDRERRSRVTWGMKKQTKTEALLEAFARAAEDLAHHIADSKNRVEDAWTLRGLVDGLTERTNKRDSEDDAGIYAGDYIRGSVAAKDLDLNLID